MEKQAFRQALQSQAGLRAKLFDGSFGIRLQALRVLNNGRLSRLPYPSGLGNRETNRYLTSGYSDNLMEFNGIITRSAKGAVRQLTVLEQLVDSHLNEEERLWPFSLAPSLAYEKDLDAMKNNCTRPGYEKLAERMTEKYGEIRSLMAGVHIGYSLDDDIMDALFKYFGNGDYADRTTFQNKIYFHLGQNFFLWQWLFTYLYGASPVPPKAKDIVAPKLDHQVRSLRNSSFGYGNLPGEKVSYLSFDDYQKTLQGYLDSGVYSDAAEFQGPVGLHNGDDDLATVGASYLSLRHFDLDPFATSGISEDTLNFVELVLAYFLITDHRDVSQADLDLAQKRNEEIALQEPTEMFDWVGEEAQKLTDALDQFVEDYQAPKRYRLALQFVKRRLEDPHLTLAGQMVDKTESGSFLSFGLKLANDRYTALIQSHEPLEVMGSVCSKSIQEMIREAIVLGIRVQFSDDEIEFSYGDHTEEFSPDMNVGSSEGPEMQLRRLFPEVDEQ